MRERIGTIFYLLRLAFVQPIEFQSVVGILLIFIVKT